MAPVSLLSQGRACPPDSRAGVRLLKPGVQEDAGDLPAKTAEIQENVAIEKRSS